MFAALGTEDGNENCFELSRSQREGEMTSCGEDDEIAWDKVEFFDCIWEMKELVLSFTLIC